MPQHRIAFLTCEFPTENDREGGLANYLNRISKALTDLGCNVEVFTLSDHPAETLTFNGYTVHRVSWPARTNIDAIKEMPGKLWGRLSVANVNRFERGGRALADTFNARNQAAPFQLVQTNNYDCAGRFIDRPRDVTHVVRCSSVGSLIRKALNLTATATHVALSRHELQSVQRCHICYAPSKAIADYYTEHRDDGVKVLRPPFFVETQPDVSQLPGNLPDRFLFHFGSIGEVKGSDVLAAALPIAWKQEPTLKMVWAGRLLKENFMRVAATRWGEHADNVAYLGALQKPAIYALLKRATAVVAPSRTDNLPNTVIESLAMGVPVIGSKGASIDELIEPGSNGSLVSIGDSNALADALVAAWRNDATWLPNGFAEPAILKQMQPNVAAKSLLELAGLETK